MKLIYCIIMFLSLPLFGFRSYSSLTEYKGWQKIIYRVLRDFQRHTEFSFHFKIHSKKQINCYTFSDKKKTYFQLVIMTGLLDKLDRFIQDRSFHCSKNCRYQMIAPILAHELAHYLQNDIANRHKILKNRNPSRRNKLLQKLEWHADLYALKIMADAKIAQAAQTMQKLFQFLRSQSRGQYRKSHPSLTERIYRLGNQRYRLSYQLHQAFSIIETKKNSNLLHSACKRIEYALIRFPTNSELKQALPVCYHKLWLSTAEYSCIEFPHFIDTIVFSDSDEYISKQAKGCGSIVFYQQARQEYQKIYQQSDSNLRMNYALLLAYHKKMVIPLRKYEKQLLTTIDKMKLAMRADGLLNLGVYYYLQRKYTLARAIFSAKPRKNGNASIDKTFFSSYKRNRQVVACTYIVNQALFQSYRRPKYYKINQKQMIKKIRNCSPVWADYVQTNSFL